MMGDQPIDVVVFDAHPGDADAKRYWMRFRCRWDADLAAFASGEALLAKHARRLERGGPDALGLAPRESYVDGDAAPVPSGAAATFAASAAAAAPKSLVVPGAL